MQIPDIFDPLLDGLGVSIRPGHARHGRLLVRGGLGDGSQLQVEHVLVALLRARFVQHRET